MRMRPRSKRCSFHECWRCRSQEASVAVSGIAAGVALGSSRVAPGAVVWPVGCGLREDSCGLGEQLCDLGEQLCSPGEQLRGRGEAVLGIVKCIGLFVARAGSPEKSQFRIPESPGRAGRPEKYCKACWCSRGRAKNCECLGLDRRVMSRCEIVTRYF